MILALADPSALSDDTLESCRYLLRGTLRGHCEAGSHAGR